MRGQLTKEIRLEISVTRLKKGTVKLRKENHIFKQTIKEKEKEIKILESKLIDKESQRKELLGFLYKPKKKDGEKKPLGKKIGALGYHRPIPKEDGDLPLNPNTW